MADNQVVDWAKIVAQLNNVLPDLASSGSYQLTSDGYLIPGAVTGSALSPIDGNFNLPDFSPARASSPYTAQSAYLSLLGLVAPGVAFTSYSNSEADIQSRIASIYNADPGSAGVFDSYLNFKNYVAFNLDSSDRDLWESGLLQDFEFLQGLDPTGATMGGWSDLVIFPASSGTADNSILIDPETSQTLKDIYGNAITTPAQLNLLMMSNTFTYFMQHYSLPSTLLFNSPARQFIMDWQRFLVSRGTIEDSGTSQLAGFPDYREIYDAFNPTGNAAEYQQKLVEYYRETVNQYGYFLPSHFLAGWVKKVQETALVSVGALSSISGTGSSKTLILLRLFVLLVEMIEQLQRVTAAQANRLKFYASYQKAYTQLLAKIPVINVKNIAQRVDADGQTETQIAQAVQQFTSQWTEIQRGYRSVVGDESKEHQTAVNQSNEIVNQQAQLGTSILQQMSTILTTIFK